MNISLITVGKSCPDWINKGYEHYAKRLSSPCSLTLKEIPAAKRVKTKTVTQFKTQEGQAMLAAIPTKSHVIALDVNGQAWSTEQLAAQIKKWEELSCPIALLVGGPDGLAPECLDRAQQTWSLSNLTLPQPMVRVLIAEQLYRAVSLNIGHPYHRA